MSSDEGNITECERVQRCTHFVPAQRTPLSPSQRNPCKSAKADARIRTGDPFITSEVLYQLSYVGKMPRVARLRQRERPPKGPQSVRG